MKKWIAWILILTLLMGSTSCKRVIGEDGASAGEYVDGEEQQMSGDSPDKVTDWETLDPSGATGKPSTQRPNGQQEENNGEKPSEQNPAEQPDEEQKEDAEKPDQTPGKQPDQEQENDAPITDPEQNPVEQPDNAPSTDDNEENLEEDPEEEFEEDPEDEEPEEDEGNGPSATLNPTVKPSTPVDPKANELKIISYNVRTSNDGEGKNVADRAPRFKKAMDQYDPDVMGLQEVSSRWLPYLEDYFTDEYDYIHRWRAASSKEGTPIFWKKDKFTCLDSGYFWLSDTPEKESIAYSWGAEKYYRICMWVKLRVKATGKIFLFYNTHFDTTAGPKVPSAKLVIERAVEKGGFDRYAVFCTGDFNMKPDTDGYKAMYARFHDINRDLKNDKTPTYTSYGTKAGSIIDFCFYSPGKVQPIKYKVITELVDGGHISDHYGLYIEAKLL